MSDETGGVLRCESCDEPIIPLPGAGDTSGTDAADAVCVDCRKEENDG